MRTARKFSVCSFFFFIVDSRRGKGHYSTLCSTFRKSGQLLLMKTKSVVQYMAPQIFGV